MYVRLVADHDRLLRPRGVLQAAYDLVESGPLDEGEAETLREAIRWLGRNLPAPEEAAVPYRAVFWFKPNATEHVEQLRQLADRLRPHGYRVEQVETDDPGAVIYEDEFQVAAVAPPGARRQRERPGQDDA